MQDNDIYKSWRDKLLAEVSEKICRPCSDEQKKQYTLDYNNPLICGCRCRRIEEILASVKEIDDQLNNHS